MLAVAAQFGTEHVKSSVLLLQTFVVQTFEAPADLKALKQQVLVSSVNKILMDYAVIC